MSKLINASSEYVVHALEGMRQAHNGAYQVTGANGRVVTRAKGAEGRRVGVASGGGFGHLPLFAGYVGRGLLDACAVGNVFAGPSLDDVTEALKAADRGAGVLSVIGNYGGDTMVFGLASDLCRTAGLDCLTVTVADDIASAPPERCETRRGVAGIIFAFKIAGAASEAGMTLDEVKRVTDKAMDNCRSIGVALSACSLPGAGKATFELPDDTIEMGMGIHGETGIWRGPLVSADELTSEMVQRLQADLQLKRGDRVAVLVNSLGATPLDELYIVYRKVDLCLADMGVEIVHSMVGPYVTSMEMAGASITFMRVDDELMQLLAAPVSCPMWRQ